MQKRVGRAIAGSAVGMLALGGVVGSAVPASATIHEIVASFCSGRDVQDPPGLSREGSKNFAQPLEATGVFTGLVFDPQLGGLVVQFNFSRAPAKFQQGDGYVQVGTTPDGTPIFLPNLIPDHVAFEHCPNFAIPEE